ncbi:MAG: hypothetical protein WCI20_03230, partial [bacterium]
LNPTRLCTGMTFNRMSNSTTNYTGAGAAPRTVTSLGPFLYDSGCPHDFLLRVSFRFMQNYTAY